MGLLDRFDSPIFLWLILGAGAFAWLARRSLAGLGPVRGKSALGARAVVFILLVMALAGANRIRKHDDLTVLFLLDQSRSIPVDLRREAERFIRKSTSAMRPNDRAAVVTFDGQSNIEQLPSRRGPEGGIHVPMPLADGQKPDQSDLAQGLRVAAACSLDSTNNRIVLLSDGNQNVGDFLAEARAAAANHMTIDVVPLRREQGAEIIFEQLRAPSYANENEMVSLRLILRSDRATTGLIRVYQRIGSEESLVDLDSASPEYGQRRALQPGRNAFVVRLPIRESRAHEFRAEFIPDDTSADVVAQNNVARAFTNVEGPQTLLFVGSQAGREDDEPLVSALQSEGVRVQWEIAESIALDTSVLQGYAAVVLSNVGANLFSGEQQQALATYVRDLGGGLIMIGGDDSFGAGGWQGSVVEEIMPVKFDVDAIKQIPRGALAVVMHSCEMPQGNQWGIETAIAALKALSSLDYFGVVSYGLGGFVWDVKMQPATNKDAIAAQIRKMANSDMFDFETPVNMSLQALINCRDAAQRHMIIISDGDPQPPSTGLLNKLVGNKITCSTVSIFPHGGAEIDTLKRIARITGGSYYPLNNAGDEKMLPRILIKEAKIVRRPLLRDEIFKPQVKSSLSDVVEGIGADLPNLRGYVVTTPRKVVDVEMPLATPRGDPLLAHWLCGFGRTVAFTSGQWRRWGADWPGWPGFSKLWAQIVRWSMQQGSAANYDVQTIVDGDRGRVLIESVEDPADGGASAFRQFVGKVIAPDGTSHDVAIVQTGPGKYEGQFPVNQQGTFLLNVAASGGAAGKPVLIRTGVTAAYSPEYRDLGVNEAILREAAELTRGRVLTLDADPKEVYAHNLPPTISRSPIWNLLLTWAVFLFLLDVAIRRVAIDPVQVAVAVRGYVASLAGRLGAGRRAERTLADLKSVRERVRAERTASRDEVKSPTTSAPAVSPTVRDETLPAASAKFDATQPGKKPAADLTAAMGGHADKSTAPKPAPSQETPKPSESTTARLLKARKRARDESSDSPPPGDKKE